MRSYLFWRSKLNEGGGRRAEDGGRRSEVGGRRAESRGEGERVRRGEGERVRRGEGEKRRRGEGEKRRRGEGERVENRVVLFTDRQNHDRDVTTIGAAIGRHGMPLHETPC